MSELETTQSNRSIELCKRVVTTESFIAEAREIYGDRYDYSKVDYKNREHRVTIVCPIHGDFQVYAREHLDGKGCPKCEKGEKFITKLKEKFGDKFGLDEFVYESSTAPVTLICPTHGAFSRLPNQILSSQLGCPMCISSVKEEKHNAAIAKKEEIKKQKQREREEIEAQRLNEWLNEREEQRKRRERALKAFQAGKKPRDFYSSFQLYQQVVDEHIDDIRYNAKWREPYCAPYRLTEDEARKLLCYREGDTFYKYPNEAPNDFYVKAFENDYGYYGGTLEEFLSHRSCIISFEGNDLIIQKETYKHELERFNKVSPKRSFKQATEIPNSFVSIDFETLYPQRVSVCSIGMVKYRDGKKVEQYYSLIRPPFDYPGKKGFRLTGVHGITKESLLNEKTFAELLPQIETFVDGLQLVAHNASVEKCCICDVCAYYEIETKLDYNNIIDTLSLSKEAEEKLDLHVEGQGAHALDAVCSRFEVPVLKHHNALEDAEMCGNLLLKFRKVLMGEKDSDSVKTKFKEAAVDETPNATTNTSPEKSCMGVLVTAFMVVLLIVFVLI